MAQTPNSGELVAIDPRESRGRYNEIAIGAVGASMQLMPQTFGEVVSFAQMMARSGPMLRPIFRDNPGACMAVIMQAMRWGGLDPWQVANKAFFVNDQIAYESQLLAAVIILRAPIQDRPDYRFEGEADQRVCIVSVTLKNGRKIEHRSPPIGKILPKNSPLWKTDPDQQQGYYTIRALSRRHFPDIVLGAYDRDEIIDLEPVVVDRRTPQEILRDKLATTTAANGGAPAGDGFVGSEAHATAQAQAAAVDAAPAAGPDQPTEPAKASEQAPAAADAAVVQEPDSGPDMTDILQDALNCFASCETIEEIEENAAIMTEPGGWFAKADAATQKIAMRFVEAARLRLAGEAAKKAAEAEAAAERAAEERLNGGEVSAADPAQQEHPALAEARAAAAKGTRKLKLACGKLSADDYAAHVAPHRKELDALARDADERNL